MKIIIKPNELKRRYQPETIYKAEPKMHSSGRRTSRHVFFTEPVICSVLCKLHDSYEVGLEIGRGELFDRSPRNSRCVEKLRFWISFDQMQSSEIVAGDLADKISTMIKDYGNASEKSFLIKDDEGIVKVENPHRFSIEKMIENHASSIALEFTGYNRETMIHNLEDLVEAETINDVQFQSICRKLSKTFNLDIDDDSEDEVTFRNIKELNFYRAIIGSLFLRESEYDNFKNDFQALVEKYHVPLKSNKIEIDSFDDLNKISLDANEVQEALLNNNIDVKETLIEYRGFASGKKYGL